MTTKGLITAAFLVAISTTVQADIWGTPPDSTNLTILIAGDVMKPGIYPFNKGLTLTQSIAGAGGFTDFADTRVHLYRDPGGFKDIGKAYRVRTINKHAYNAQKTYAKEEIVADFKRIEKNRTPDITLKPGDWIEVRRIFHF